MESGNSNLYRMMASRCSCGRAVREADGTCCFCRDDARVRGAAATWNYHRGIEDGTWWGFALGVLFGVVIGFLVSQVFFKR